MKLVCLALAVAVVADPPAFVRSHAYENGSLGVYPSLSFMSTSLRAPQLDLVRWSERCNTDDGSYLFLAPRGMLVPTPGPVLMDVHGHMVWHRSDFGAAYNFKVQRYRNQDVLTFWSGDDLFDSSYRLLHKVSALNNLTADLHEFLITPNDTAIVTAFVPLAYDLSGYNLSFFTLSTPQAPQTYIYDCIFQEIDLASSSLLFEWRASNHFRPEDCYHSPSGTAGSRADPFDYFHLNSVDKDASGDYLISARYTHALTKISGKTGEVLWNLGGKNNSFNYSNSWSYRPGGSFATQFAWQHHARWHANHTRISVFDNAAYFDDKRLPARGVSLAINETTMTASLSAQWLHPDSLIAESQGSVQMLPNGNAFVGYGSAAAFAEYTADGEILCDAHYSALYWQNDTLSPGGVTSYRIFKQRWRGWPMDDPKVKFHEGRLYMSWNGATELREWLLETKPSYGLGLKQAGNSSQADWVAVGRTLRMGFESSIPVPEGGPLVYGRKSIHINAHAVYRLTALGSNSSSQALVRDGWWKSHGSDRHVLGVWEVQTDDTIRRVADIFVPKTDGYSTLVEEFGGRTEEVSEASGSWPTSLTTGSAALPFTVAISTAAILLLVFLLIVLINRRKKGPLLKSCCTSGAQLCLWNRAYPAKTKRERHHQRESRVRQHLINRQSEQESVEES